MFKPNYVCRSRHNIYYFRWPIPKRLHPEGKPSHVKVSLNTREPKEALRSAHFLEYHADLIFQHGSLVHMDYADIRKAVHGYLSKALKERKAEIDRQGPYSPEKILELANTATLVSQAIEHDDNTLIQALIPAERIQAIVNESNLAIAPKSAAYTQLQREYRIGLRDLTQQLIAYSQQQERYDFSHQTHTQSLPALPVERNPINQVIKKYVAERKLEGAWAGKTELAREAHLALLEEILGSDFDLSLLDTRKARGVKDMLMALPANRNKIKAVKGLNVADAVKVEGVAKISVATINQYLNTYNSFCHWAKGNGYLTDNPFSGLTLDDSKRSEKRDAYSLDQIKALLVELDKREDGYAKKDYQYWGSLIGIYTGARLNEIASLTLKDLKQEDGIWYFDINDEDEKRLKTDASKRKVPVHHALLERGIIEYVHSLEKKGKDRILHELTFSVQNGYGRNLSRWFNETLLPGMGLKDEGILTFHSLRHTVITTLRNASVELPIVQALVGHTPDSITEAVYNKGYAMPQLRDALEKLSY